MKTQDWQEWRNQFMVDSDPKTGNKVGMIMEDVTIEKLSQVEDKFFEIDNKYKKYHIVITEVATGKGVCAITFDSIDEIREHKNNPLLDIFKLYITIEINDETKYHIKKHQDEALKRYDGGTVKYNGKTIKYDGIDLRKENSPEMFTFTPDLKKLSKEELPKDFDPINEINEMIGKYCSFTLEKEINFMLVSNVIPMGIGITTSFLCYDTYEEMQQIIYCLKHLSIGHIHIRNEKEFKDEYFEKRTWLIVDNAEKFSLAFFKKIDKWFDRKTVESKVNENRHKPLSIPNITLIFKIKTKPQLIDAMSKCKRSTIPIILKPSMIHWKDKR